MALELSSSVFSNGTNFPADYTCNGRNVSPPLSIAGVPAKANSLLLIIDDPDAAKEPAGNGKTFDHWIVYNLMPKDQELTEANVPEEAKQGLNSMGSDKYIGPCPPTLRHKYFFRIFALDTNLDFDHAPTKDEIELAANTHIIEQAQLTAFYEQPSR